MSFILQPWTLLFVILAGWVNELQQQAIEYLRTDNQVLKEKLGTRRILLSYNQRRRPAVERTTLRRKRLEQIGTWVTPDTILGWQRFLVARKWHYSSRKKRSTRNGLQQKIARVQPIR